MVESALSMGTICEQGVAPALPGDRRCVITRSPEVDLLSLAPDLETWSLTPLARIQLTECGTTLSQLYRVVNYPAMRTPSIYEGEERLNGYGLTVIISGREILAVEIDGATATNWQEWAVERAEFGDGDVAGADALVQAVMAKPERVKMPRQKKITPPAPAPRKAHVLDRVHPAMREEITRQCEGDFRRLVIHSATKVQVLPPR